MNAPRQACRGCRLRRSAARSGSSSRRSKGGEFLRNLGWSGFKDHVRHGSPTPTEKHNGDTYSIAPISNLIGRYANRMITHPPFDFSNPLSW
jgi:hypothetical protein